MSENRDLFPETARSSPKCQTAEASNTRSRKEEYRAFCRQETSIPLFSRDWWLDAAVGPDGWDVALVRKGQHVLASMPYVLRRRFGFQLVTQPPLTPMLGPWTRRATGRPSTQLGNGNELMQALIDQLPAFDHFTQTWAPSVSNWQTFFWNGFQQTTYYTYVLRDISDLEKLWTKLGSKVRRAIVKAETDYGFQIRDDLALESLLDLNRKTFARQGLSPPYSDELVRRLDQACMERGCRKLVFVVNSDGVPVSGEYFVWDEHSAYGLLAGTDPAYRQSGAASLAQWAAIRHAAEVSHQYNHCGSMMRPVNRFFRSFGGDQLPYFYVSKTPSCLLAIRRCLLSLARSR